MANLKSGKGNSPLGLPRITAAWCLYCLFTTGTVYPTDPLHYVNFRPTSTYYYGLWTNLGVDFFLL